MRKHREVLNISLDPPETKRILLKTKIFVNACLRCGQKKIWRQLRGEAASTKNNRCKKLLALRKSCDIFPAFASPTSLNAGNSGRASVGKAENPNSGGAAQWASCYS
jgi:hypothetical protein